MERVSDVFAFALSKPALWSGLLFDEDLVNGKVPGITNDERLAVLKARPHLEESIRGLLFSAHEALQERARRSKAPACESLARAKHYPKKQLPWLRAEVALVDWKGSLVFGLSDDIGDQVRPFVTLWTKLKHQETLATAAGKCPVEPGVECRTYGQSTVWYFPTPIASQPFGEVSRHMVATTWPAILHLCKTLSKATTTSA
ncbi:MAG: hypothetical protein JNM72_21975 [Deltaproteobacteria bacterium]|nr:hypothetical protein [Deltaproteobacteria bacterium]